jgi:sugar phosphate isomerase/epimerase
VIGAGGALIYGFSGVGQDCHTRVNSHGYQLEHFDWWAKTGGCVARTPGGEEEPDRARTFDELAALTELAAARGIDTCVEPVVGLSIADLASAIAAVEYVNRVEITLLIDTMQEACFDASAEDLRSIPAERIGYIQLSDTTMQRRMEHYAEEAMYERMTPGEGELPLLDMLAALPQDRVVGLEIPMRASAGAGVSAYDRLLPCADSARSSLARASGIG